MTPKEINRALAKTLAEIRSEGRQGRARIVTVAHGRECPAKRDANLDCTCAPAIIISELVEARPIARGYH